MPAPSFTEVVDMLRPPGAPSARDRIAGFYPDATEEQAAAALQQTRWADALPSMQREAEAAFAAGDWARVLFEAAAAEDWRDDMATSP